MREALLSCMLTAGPPLAEDEEAVAETLGWWAGEISEMGDMTSFMELPPPGPLTPEITGRKNSSEERRESKPPTPPPTVPPPSSKELLWVSMERRLAKLKFEKR